MQPTSNGHSATDFDAGIAATLVNEIARRRVRIDELEQELALLTPEVKRYERALALITNETPPAKTGPKPKTATTPDKKRLSDSAYKEIHDAVIRFAADHEEFRQVDVRVANGDTGHFRSSTLALGFEALRQNNILRFARQEGNNKYFRLTRAAATVDA